MRKIFKYHARVGHFSVKMPTGAEVLSIQVQDGNFVMWARVDESEPPTTRRFALIETGLDLEHAARWNYIGTIQDDQFVWHLLAE